MSNPPFLISLFNHKGGVSKTTLTFHLGWALANRGIKTLIVDADPQCNLTASVLGLQDSDKIKNFYDSKKNDDLYTRIKPVIEGTSSSSSNLLINPCVTKNENLLLAAGHLNLSELDLQLSISLQSRGYLPVTKPFIGLVQNIVRQTAKKHDCKVVLIDMSPSVGALNRSILMGSDYFLIPTSPDFFSYQAIQALGDLLVQWKEDFKEYRDPATPNALPSIPPKMLGVISQKFRSYNSSSLSDLLPGGESRKETRIQQAAKSYQKWIDKIQLASDEDLAKTLNKHGMVISKEIFKKYIQDEKPYNLASIGDFNSLIALSQLYEKPVFELNDNELDYSGAILAQQKEKQQEFKKIFDNLASRVTSIIEEDASKPSSLF